MNVKVSQARKSWDICKEEPQAKRYIMSFLTRHGIDLLDPTIGSHTITLAHDKHSHALVGIFQYTGAGCLHPMGTWVCHTRRREGIATLMWEHALRRHCSRYGNIKMHTVSRAGTGFVRSMQRVHKDKVILFEVHHG